MRRLLDHYPDGMGNLCRQAVVFEGRHEADDGLWGSGADGSDICMAGGRVVRFHVNAAGSAYNLAAVNRPLEGDTRHTEFFNVARSHDSVALYVPKQSLDVAGGWHDRFGKVLRFLCPNSFGKRFRNILASASVDCPHSQHYSTAPACKATYV